jgi:hypothetical protein
VAQWHSARLHAQGPGFNPEAPPNQKNPTTYFNMKINPKLREKAVLKDSVFVHVCVCVCVCEREREREREREILNEHGAKLSLLILICFCIFFLNFQKSYTTFIKLFYYHVNVVLGYTVTFTNILTIHHS